MKGKLIVIEGTDCSGKETQTKLLVERLEKENQEKAIVETKNRQNKTPCRNQRQGKQTSTEGDSGGSPGSPIALPFESAGVVCQLV